MPLDMLMARFPRLQKGKTTGDFGWNNNFKFVGQVAVMEMKNESEESILV